MPPNVGPVQAAEISELLLRHAELLPLLAPRRLGYDTHRRLSKLYAREEKKSKSSWGAQIVDYEKIATAAVEHMKTADLNRFLVFSALVSDLYCPGYNPTQSLDKNSNLARTATRYKLDTPKLVTAVRHELSKPKKPPITRRPAQVSSRK